MKRKVLGEIKHPRKNFPKAMWWGMGMVSVLYLAVNICYASIPSSDDSVHYHLKLTGLWSRC